MTDTTTDFVTVTSVRKALIAESYEHLAAMKQITAKRRRGETLTVPEPDLFDALSKVNVYSYLLAAVLRRIEAAQGAAAASGMAQWFDTVMDVGTEVMEDANDDLDEQARHIVAS